MRLLNQVESLQQQVEKLTQENQRLKEMQSYAQTKLQTQEVAVTDQKIIEETVSSNNPFSNQVGYQSHGNTSQATVSQQNLLQRPSMYQNLNE